MWKDRFLALLVLVAGLAVGYFSYTPEFFGYSTPFKLGLDLAGGTQLVYKADISELPSTDVDASMQSLRDVIERRVNLFGVAEPLVQEEQGLLSGERRLVVELPGVTDVKEAIDQIGQTPVLEFKLMVEVPAADPTSSSTAAFLPTGLTGRQLSGAQLQFSQGTAGQFSNDPIILLNFNSEGAALFEKITGENVGQPLAIFLDGEMISAPVIREAISGGVATISGQFTPEEGRELARNLNFGALPVPIELVTTETIGATLGEESFARSIAAGVYGLIFVAIFMVLWYRLPGIIAVVALLVYVAIMLALFKLIPVTLTAAGLAAFILSIGLAVDANILIFERIKEEFARGRSTHDAMHEGFARAWPAIRDSNIAHIITASILFFMGTSLIQGFALVFGLGVIVSMLSAITISRNFLYAVSITHNTAFGRFMLDSGFVNSKKS